MGIPSGVIFPIAETGLVLSRPENDADALVDRYEIAVLEHEEIPARAAAASRLHVALP
jgi:hypothetical protein